MISARDDAFRAGLCMAYELRGKPGYREAIDRAIFIFEEFPLIRYHDAILAAERDIEERVSQVEAEPWLVHELLPGFYE